MSTVRFSVPAVACQHCVAAVSAEVGAVPGVSSVVVSLDDKLVTVSGGAAPEAVAAAIVEAGYEVAGHEMTGVPQPAPAG